MTTNERRLHSEINRIEEIEDDTVREALLAFVAALRPDRSRTRLRKPRSDGTLREVDTNTATASAYSSSMRILHNRGLDVLGCSTEEFNEFIRAMCDGDLDDYDGSVMRTTAKVYQSAARALYCFLDEPGKSDERPDAAIEWPADDIIVFSDKSDPRYDDSDMFTEDEINSLREGCIRGLMPRRDRALLELLAGTCQRIEALRTLKVKHVETGPDDGPPYILLNTEIQGEGDKGAIDAAGRWRPIVSDVGPVREYIEHHPLMDRDVRQEHGCPNRFEDCYLFVGDPSHPETNASRPWEQSAIRSRLGRLGETAGVDKPVKPHNFRHYAYSKSKELAIDEDARRKVFGWKPGSDTGDRVYGHVTGQQHGRRFADAWAGQFGEDDALDRLRSRLDDDPELLDDLEASGEEDLANRLAEVLDG